MGFCGECAWASDGMYCNKKKKEIGYFGEQKCFATEEEKRNELHLPPLEKETETTQKENSMENNNTMTTKVCKVCGRELPINQFRKNPKCKDGHLDTCYECLSKKNKEKKGKEENAENNVGAEARPDNGFPPTQDKYDRLQEYTPQELVDRLRFLGWTVTCTMTISI